MIPRFVLLLLLLVDYGESFTFSPKTLRHERIVLSASNPIDSASAIATPSTLPPGRPTPRFLGLLFDDTLPLLNPKTMGSYQVKRKRQCGNIFKTNIFFGPAAVAADLSSVKELANQEASKKRSLEACFPPHHQKLFGPQSLLVQSGTTHDKLRRLIQPSLSPRNMKSFQPTVETALDSLLGRLTDTYKDGTTFAVVPELRDFFMEIALNVLLGASEAKHCPPRIGHAHRRIGRISGNPAFTQWLQNLNPARLIRV